MGVFRGQQIKSAGNVMNCPENQNHLFKKKTVVVEVLGGQKIKSPGNVMNGRENRTKLLKNPVVGGCFMGSKTQKVQEIS